MLCVTRGVAVLLLAGVVPTACGDGGSNGDTGKAPAPSETAPPAAGATTAATYDDAFAYCASAGTVGEVAPFGEIKDRRYTGPPVPEAVISFFIEKFQLGDYWRSDSFYTWRCFEGKVWACWWGANLPCGQADIRTEPSPGMVESCREHPDQPLSAADTGHSTIYAWECRDGVAVIERQVFQVDARGFVADFWYEISP